MNIKKQLSKLKVKFPALKIVNITYSGSGDEFGDFWNIVDENEVDIPNSQEFMSEADDLIWHCLENSGADFNNDGSEGTITFDFDAMKVKIENNYFETVSVPGGTTEFE